MTDRPIQGIYGHGAQRAHFEALVAAGELAPAYLFCGPQGVGKMAFAREVARATLCKGGGCRGTSCPSCAKVASGHHPDLHVYEAQGESLPIDHVRDLREKVSRLPWESSYRFGILDGVERLAAEAGNALLKTLEEPPEHARLILVLAGSGKLLPTIESRCQRVRFGPLGPADFAAALAGRGVPEDRGALLAPLCDGRPGLALAAGDAILGVRERVFQVWRARPGLDTAGTRLSVAVVGDADPPVARDAAKGALDCLELALRDRLAELAGATELLAPDVPAELRAGLGSDVEELLVRIDRVADWRAAIKSNVNPRLVLEDAGAVIAEVSRGG